MYLTFQLQTKSVGAITCLVARSENPGKGGSEFETLLYRAEQTLRKFADARFFDAVLDTLASDAPFILVSRNEKAILDNGFLERLEATVSKLQPYKDKYSLASPLGLGGDGRALIGSFSSEEPTLITCADILPIMSSCADLYLADRTCLETVLRDCPNLNEAALEAAIIAIGLRQGKLALYLPTLSVGICGKYKSVDLPKLVDWAQKDLKSIFPGSSIPTFMGQIEIPMPEDTDRLSDVGILARKNSYMSMFEQLSASHCRRLNISIVTRTTFSRLHLIRRLLTSIERAKDANTDVEVILSTDISPEKANAAFSELKAEFINSNLVLQINSGPQASRVRNMVGGILAAKSEYVWMMDDDDYVDLFAFKHIRERLFGEFKPLIFATCDLHNEQWDVEDSDFPVLKSSRRQHSWPSNGWRGMFNGVNQVPVCGAIIPREFVSACLNAFEMRYDFSEDYTLFLLMIGSRGLPPIIEITEPVAHISVRTSTDQTVTLSDRTGWTRDINGFLYDLIVSNQRLDFNLWGNLSAQPPTAHLVSSETALGEMTRELSTSRRQVEILKDRLSSVEAQWLIKLRSIEAEPSISIEAPPSPQPVAPTRTLQRKIKDRLIRYSRNPADLLKIRLR